MHIIIADDDALVSASLKTILESGGQVKVDGCAGDGAEAIRLYREYKPDIALLDIQMPGKNGLEAAEEIMEMDSRAKVLFLTTFSDNEYITKALALGSSGYILKQDFESILPALQAVRSGQSVFGSDIVSRLPKVLAGVKRFSYRDYDINEKEEEIIIQVAKGLNNKEIAETLFLSEGTVRNYLSIILSKLHLRDRTQLAVFHYTHNN